MVKTLTLLIIVSLITSTSWLGYDLTQTEWKRPSVTYPENNPLNEASIELGNALFFETLLSKDSSISCMSCHVITEAFADHLPVGEGIKGRMVTRNTPSVVNIGLHPYFMADGKFESLEEQVLGPINEHREFDMSPDEVVRRLKTVERYNELSRIAYQREIDIDLVQKALANFQRILISDTTRFDRYMWGKSQLSEKEAKGWKLFNSEELNCVKCHSGFNFTNYAFENNGLYETYQDSGRALITKDSKDLAKFKVPSLRNVAVTYPYMHNGSINTLEEVLNHYANGGKDHPSQSKFVKGFEMKQSDKDALLAFLNTLTEERYRK